jgi:hypothetical protein
MPLADAIPQITRPPSEAVKLIGSAQFELSG